MRNIRRLRTVSRSFRSPCGRIGTAAAMENVRWLSNWYGYEQPDGTTTIQLNAKGDIVPLIDDNSMYKKILQFYFKANQMGLVDPDSPTQDWNKVSEKLTNKQVLLLWYSWETGFYNSIERGKNGDGNRCGSDRRHAHHSEQRCLLRQRKGICDRLQSQRSRSDHGIHGLALLLLKACATI